VIAYLSRRLLGLVPLLLGITLISFMVIHVAPGSPMDLLTDMNPDASPELRDRLAEHWGLDEPLPVQYAMWLKRVVVGDFGNSLSRDPRPVIDKVAEALPVTLVLPRFHNRADAYARVRADPVLGPALDNALVPALEATGAPEARLQAMVSAANAAREAFTAAGGSPTQDFNGLDPVQLDLKQALFVALAGAIGADPRGADEKRVALDSLDALVTADWPIGLPSDNEMAPWTIGARLDATLAIQLAREGLQAPAP